MPFVTGRRILGETHSAFEPVSTELQRRYIVLSRTVIDLDDELLAAVARALGTRTKTETVNTALREVLDRRQRALALTRLRATPSTERST